MIYKIDTVDSDDKICQLEKLAKEIWNQHFVRSDNRSGSGRLYA